jgi:hypothetical protein
MPEHRYSKYAIFVSEMKLYHGSATAGIESLHPAEDDTVGSGVYLTSEPRHAIGYALARVSHSATAVLYETRISNLVLLDLRNDDAVREVMHEFAAILWKELSKANLHWAWERAILNSLEQIGSGKFNHGNIKTITQCCGKLFSSFIQSLGFDGLIATEGGEPWYQNGKGHEIGNHDSYVIFDPNKVTVLSGRMMKLENFYDFNTSSTCDST